MTIVVTTDHRQVCCDPVRTVSALPGGRPAANVPHGAGLISAMHCTQLGRASMATRGDFQRQRVLLHALHPQRFTPLAPERFRGAAAGSSQGETGTHGGRRLTFQINLPRRPYHMPRWCVVHSPVLRRRRLPACRGWSQDQRCGHRSSHNPRRSFPIRHPPHRQQRSWAARP